MPFLRRDTSHDSLNLAASPVGQLVGMVLQQGVGQDRRQAMLADMQRYVDANPDAEPGKFAAGLLGVLAAHGAEPGPIFERLTAAHTSDWKERQGKAERTAMAEALTPYRQIPANPVPETVPVRRQYGGIAVEDLPDEGNALEQLRTRLRGEATDQWHADRAEAEAYNQGQAQKRSWLSALPVTTQATLAAKEDTPSTETQWVKGKGWATYDKRSGRSGFTPVAGMDPEGPEVLDKVKNDDGSISVFYADGTSRHFARPEGAPEPQPKGHGDKPFLPPEVESAYLTPEGQRTDAQKLTVSQWERLHPGKQPQRTMRVRTNPDGSVEIVEGAEGAELSKPTRGLVEKDMKSVQDGLDRLQSVAQQFDANFMTYGGKVEAWWLGIKDKAGGKLGRLSPEEQDFLGRYSSFTADAIEQLNGYIKDVTGAAMSEREADRIRRAIPDPQRDGPQQFAAKWGAVTRRLARAEERYRKLLQEGFTPSQIGKLVRSGQVDSISDVPEALPPTPTGARRKVSGQTGRPR